MSANTQHIMNNRKC